MRDENAKGRLPCRLYGLRNLLCAAVLAALRRWVEDEADDGTAGEGGFEDVVDPSGLGVRGFKAGEEEGEEILIGLYVGGRGSWHGREGEAESEEGAAEGGGNDEGLGRGVVREVAVVLVGSLGGGGGWKREGEGGDRARREVFGRVGDVVAVAEGEDHDFGTLREGDGDGRGTGRCAVGEEEDLARFRRYLSFAVLLRVRDDVVRTRERRRDRGRRRRSSARRDGRGGGRERNRAREEDLARTGGGADGVVRGGGESGKDGAIGREGEVDDGLRKRSVSLRRFSERSKRAYLRLFDLFAVLFQHVFALRNLLTAQSAFDIEESSGAVAEHDCKDLLGGVLGVEADEGRSGCGREGEVKETLVTARGEGCEHTEGTDRWEETYEASASSANLSLMLQSVNPPLSVAVTKCLFSPPSSLLVPGATASSTILFSAPLLPFFSFPPFAGFNNALPPLSLSMTLTRSPFVAYPIPPSQTPASLPLLHPPLLRSISVIGVVAGREDASDSRCGCATVIWRVWGEEREKAERGRRRPREEGAQEGWEGREEAGERREEERKVEVPKESCEPLPFERWVCWWRGEEGRDGAGEAAGVGSLGPTGFSSRSLLGLADLDLGPLPLPATGPEERM